MDRPCIQPVAISYASCPLLLFTRFLLQYFNTTACLRSNFNVKVGSHLFSFHCLHWDHPLPIGSHLLAMTSSQTASLLSPWIPSLRSTLKTADRNPLARCESDHASLLLKTHPGHPISPGAKASLVTSTNLVSLFFSLMLPCPLFQLQPSYSATFVATGPLLWLMLLPAVLSPKGQSSLFPRFHQAFICSNAISQ